MHEKHASEVRQWFFLTSCWSSPPSLTTAFLLCREIALEVLSQEPVGAFMVRESTTKHGCYALSLRVPRDFQVSGIAHYLILNTAKGYKIKVSAGGATQLWK